MSRSSVHALLIIILSLTFLSVRISTTKAIQIDLSGQVSSVQDGNTFTLISGQTIRLADIDIPGINQRGYDQAKTSLTNLVNGKTVYLDQSSLDGVIDGRLICIVYVDYDSQNYLNVNEKMAESGYVTKVDYRNDFDPTTWTLLVTKPSLQVSYTLTIQTPEGSGSTNPTAGNYVYNQVVTVPVQANPSSGWALDHWLLDGSNTGSQNPYVVNMNSDHQLKAVFTQSQTPTPPPATYKLTIQSPTGSGSTDPVTGSYSYSQVVSVDVRAIPSSGWKFEYWVLDGLNVGDVNPVNVNVGHDRVIQAVFTQSQTPTPPPATYKLTIQSPTGSGSTDPVTGSYTYQQPVRVPVKATPSSGWVFDHWVLDGANAGNVNPYDVVMNVDHTIKAVFVANAGVSSSGGVPGYPLESLSLGIILGFALIIYLTRAHSHRLGD